MRVLVDSDQGFGGAISAAFALSAGLEVGEQ